MTLRLRPALWALALILVFALPVLAAPQIVWTDQHDGGATFIDDGFCLLNAPDGHLIVGGESADTVGGSDLFIRKLNRDTGDELWDVRYEGYDGKDVAITEMEWDSAGQLLVSAFIRGCIG
jgi:hypothetical protein